MNRENWQHDGWGFHFPDDVNTAELDFMEERLGPKYLRAVPALIAAGISPWRHDQFNEITRLSKLLGLSSEVAGSCFGYIEGKHVFEGMLEPNAHKPIMPRTAAGLAIWRLITGIPLPKLQASKAGADIAARKGFYI